MFMTARSTKPFWKSSTFWINAAGIVVTILTIVINSDIIPDADVVAIVTAILNILNRLRAPASIKKLTIR